MLTYTLKVFANRASYHKAWEDSKAVDFISNSFFTKENGEEGTLYLIYSLERDGYSIPFLNEKTEQGDCIVWRIAEGEKE